MPPPSSGHWHFPWSRFQTSRLTAAGTWRERWAPAVGTVAPGDGVASGDVVEFRGFFTIPRRFACRARMRSSPTSRISSSVAPG